MLSSIKISKFYDDRRITQLNCTIKDSPRDFIVQEVVESRVCEFAPIIDFEKFLQAKELLNNLPQGLDKEARKEIYKIANYHPYKKLVTKDGDFVVLEDTKDIFVLTVAKYNYSSNSMINFFAKNLSIPENCIQIGGNKDKKAITLQEISINCNFEAIFSLAVSLNRRAIGCKFRELGYLDEHDDTNKKVISALQNYIFPVEIGENDSIMICDIRRGRSKMLGDLDGNIFTIRINKVLKFDEPPKNFINYYGKQRFGNKMNNHIIGEEILNKNYDKVIDLIMEDINPSIYQIIVEYYKMVTIFTNKYQLILDKIMNVNDLLDAVIKPKISENNLGILKSLLKNIEVCTNQINDELFESNNLLDNFRRLHPEYFNPSRLQKYILNMKAKGNHNKYIVNTFSRMARMIYLHAYQSYIFNVDVNRRLSGTCMDSDDRILIDGVFTQVTETTNIDEIYIPLRRMKDKLLKGGYRKVIEAFDNLEIFNEEKATVFKFFLNKSCYATMALRELIGDYEENFDLFE